MLLQSNPSAPEPTNSTPGTDSDPPDGESTAQSKSPDDEPASNIPSDDVSACKQPSDCQPSTDIDAAVPPSPPSPSRPKKMSKKELMKSRLASKKAKAKATVDLVVPSVTQTTRTAAPDLDPSLLTMGIHRAAILASITGKPFEDVKFYAFSRRLRNRKAVGNALPLVANSALIRNVTAHFNPLLETDPGVRNIGAPQPVSQQVDADFIGLGRAEGEREGSSSVQATRCEAGTRGEERGEADWAEVTLPESKRVVMKPERVVVLKDVAYTTWKAFIFYTYFGELNFAPLASQLQKQAMKAESDTAPLCSPKSMYRVAHKYNIPSLQKKAIEDIKAKLSPLNILEEIFTSFTSRYPDVRNMELEYLHSNMEDTGIQSRLPSWLRKLEQNQLPSGASEIFASLFASLFTTLNALQSSTKPGVSDSSADSSLQLPGSLEQKTAE
ncbi:hypothetical protein BD309DRAFT_91058 [Dichomitus squalens]|uniref:Uncharacterized protein n=1 Tax=Dichomitus squalens TaxID=114155 RepID=A0A4Q9NQZ3_9APHY|nr:hypothetical protein BD309DRAFT_91058 [Dichomitus squalens]TBU64516.1 hypothetical protein BD310DRAFT_400833 [Dichomitus squalens]